MQCIFVSRILTISVVGSIGIYIHISYNFISEYNRPNRLVIFIANDRSFRIIKVIWNRGNHGFTLKDTMQIDKLNTFVNEWNFDKMSLMFDLRTDIRTMEMLNITPRLKDCFTYNLLALL